MVEAVAEQTQITSQRDVIAKLRSLLERHSMSFAKPKMKFDLDGRDGLKFLRFVLMAIKS